MPLDDFLNKLAERMGALKKFSDASEAYWNTKIQAIYPPNFESWDAARKRAWLSRQIPVLQRQIAEIEDGKATLLDLEAPNAGFLDGLNTGVSETVIRAQLYVKEKQLSDLQLLFESLREPGKPPAARHQPTSREDLRQERSAVEQRIAEVRSEFDRKIAEATSDTERQFFKNKYDQKLRELNEQWMKYL